MSFNLLKDSTILTEKEKVKLKEQPIIQEIKIGIVTHPNGSKEYLINMNDMDFVAEFLNGLINKLSKEK